MPYRETNRPKEYAMTIRLLRIANTRAFDLHEAVSFCIAGCMTGLMLAVTRIIAG